MEFDPSKYSSTSYDSMGPALDLLSLIHNKYGIDFNQPLRIVDLGCGPGNSSQLLAKKFPNSTVIGIDVVAEMIEHAKKIYSNDSLKFFVQDLNLPFDQWDHSIQEILSSKSIDLIFSNYALQWISNPFTLGDSIQRILKPETGIFMANILYSDIFSVIDPNANQQEYQLLKNYLKFPNEQQFIGDWIFGLKKNANLNNIWLQYWRPKSIYPEKYYCQSFVKIPLKWHEKFIIDDAPDDIRAKLSEILKNLILKKRIKRVIPRNMNGSSAITHETDDNNNNLSKNANNVYNAVNVDDDEVNDIEIEQELWTIIARTSNQ